MTRTEADRLRERRRIEAAYGRGTVGTVSYAQPAGRAREPDAYAFGSMPTMEETIGLAPGVPAAATPAEAPFEVPGNAIQRWSEAPEDRSKRNAYGFTPGQMYGLNTGRIDARAQQSPRDTTPSATQKKPAVGGFSGAWSQMFEGGMPSTPEATRPAGGYSWEKKRDMSLTRPPSGYSWEARNQRPTGTPAYGRTGGRYSGWTAY